MRRSAIITGRGNLRLLAAFLVAAAGLALAGNFRRGAVERPCADPMRRAAALAARWFEIVEEQKERRGIVSDARTSIGHPGMLGSDWSPLTTTLGSLEAKEIAANPDFAALVVMWLHEAGVDSTDRAGVALSGSFPSLAISVFAALETLGIEATVVSSLGASSYGANQPGATWLDIESWLAGEGSFGYRSAVVTMGAEGDAGGGLSGEGMEEIRLAARRAGRELYVPGSLEESIDTKTALFERSGISVLINIGGNQASLGGCPHAATIPTGFSRSIRACRHGDRGVIVRLAEKGVPCIHLLDIRDLARRYGISAGARSGSGSGLYTETRADRTIVIAALLLIAICLVI